MEINLKNFSLSIATRVVEFENIYNGASEDLSFILLKKIAIDGFAIKIGDKAWEFLELAQPKIIEVNQVVKNEGKTHNKNDPPS